jgi:hypothetical protein
VEGDLASIEIGEELDFLARAHVFQLHLFEVGVDVHLVHGNDRQERRGRCDALAELDLASGDHAIHRGADDGAGEVNLRLIDPRLGSREVCLRLPQSEPGIGVIDHGRNVAALDLLTIDDIDRGDGPSRASIAELSRRSPSPCSSRL